jgi:hypothetical protein
MNHAAATVTMGIATPTASSAPMRRRRIGSETNRAMRPGSSSPADAAAPPAIPIATKSTGAIAENSSIVRYPEGDVMSSPDPPEEREELGRVLVEQILKLGAVPDGRVHRSGDRRHRDHAERPAEGRPAALGDPQPGERPEPRAYGGAVRGHRSPSP